MVNVGGNSSLELQIASQHFSAHVVKAVFIGCSFVGFSTSSNMSRGRTECSISMVLCVYIKRIATRTFCHCTIFISNITLNYVTRKSLNIILELYFGIFQAYMFSCFIYNINDQSTMIHVYVL